MDLYDTESHDRVLRKMRWEQIEDFSEVELERVFADFDMPEEQYLAIVALLTDRGLTIEKLYSRDLER